MAADPEEVEVERVREAFINRGPYALELTRYLFRKLGRYRHNARDLVQEVYLRYYRQKPPEFTKGELAYLYGIANHVLVDFYKNEIPGLRFAEMEEDKEPEEVPAPDLIAQLEALSEVKQLIRELPETYKQVILLHKIYGMEYKDVAEYLGLSIHTVEKYVTQALFRMREAAGVRDRWEVGSGAQQKRR